MRPLTCHAPQNPSQPQASLRNAPASSSTSSPRKAQGSWKRCEARPGPYFYFSLQSTSIPPPFASRPPPSSPSPSCSSACRHHPLLHCPASILPESAPLPFTLPQAVPSPFTSARCMIRHNIVLPTSSTLARQPVASRPSAQTAPRHGPPPPEGPGCRSTAG